MSPKQTKHDLDIVLNGWIYNQLVNLAMIGHKCLSIKTTGSGVYHRVSQQSLCNRYQTHSQTELNCFLLFSVCMSSVCWISFLLDKTQSVPTTAPGYEWHLLENWACSLSTYDPSALWSLSSKPRYVVFRQSFVPWCGFPGSSSKGHEGPLFYICKEMTKAPRHRCHFSISLADLPLFPVSVCVCNGWKRRRVWRRRQQKIPYTCPGIPGMLSEFPNLLMFTFS